MFLSPKKHGSFYHRHKTDALQYIKLPRYQRAVCYNTGSKTVLHCQVYQLGFFYLERNMAHVIIIVV